MKIIVALLLSTLITPLIGVLLLMYCFNLSLEEAFLTAGILGFVLILILDALKPEFYI